jgi:hypothetical protein
MMKNLFYTLVFSVLFQNLMAQNLVSYREAVLQKTGYNITGKAFLELYDNGDLKLRLDNDFNTSPGPDVQVFLSTSSVTGSGLMIADIGTSDGFNHFNGTITFDTPANTGIEAYDYIGFHCVKFNASWAVGTFGALITPYNCEATITATTNWVTSVSVCATDNQADEIPLLNNKGIEAGEHYAYIITDENDLIRYVHLSNTFDFEGKGNGIDRVYGVSYDGQLNYTVGQNFSAITATGCFVLSSTSVFLTVDKNACITALDDDKQLASFSFYPNPAENLVTFSNEIPYLTIYNSEGVIIKVYSNISSLDLSTFPNGIYLLSTNKKQVKLVVRH